MIHSLMLRTESLSNTRWAALVPLEEHIPLNKYCVIGEPQREPRLTTFFSNSNILIVHWNYNICTLKLVNQDKLGSEQRFLTK